MNSDFPQSPREELEARITALLLGELSPEEANLLQRRIAEEPDLVRLHDQLKQTIGLVREATASPQHELAQADAPKLSSERREKLLESFKISRPKAFKAKRWNLQWRWNVKTRELASLAAMVIGLLAAAGLLIGYRRGDHHVSHAVAMLDDEERYRARAVVSDEFLRKERLLSEQRASSVNSDGTHEYTATLWDNNGRAVNGAARTGEATARSRIGLQSGTAPTFRPPETPKTAEAQPPVNSSAPVSQTLLIAGGATASYAYSVDAGQTLAGEMLARSDAPDQSATFYDSTPKPIAGAQPEAAGKPVARAGDKAAELSGQSLAIAGRIVLPGASETAAVPAAGDQVAYSDFNSDFGSSAAGRSSPSGNKPASEPSSGSVDQRSYLTGRYVDGVEKQSEDRAIRSANLANVRQLASPVAGQSQIVDDGAVRHVNGIDAYNRPAGAKDREGNLAPDSEPRKVVLTGVTDSFGAPRAMLEIAEAKAKEPSQPAPAEPLNPSGKDDLKDGSRFGNSYGIGGAGGFGAGGIGGGSPVANTPPAATTPLPSLPAATPLPSIAKNETDLGKAVDFSDAKAMNTWGGNLGANGEQATFKSRLLLDQDRSVRGLDYSGNLSSKSGEDRKESQSDSTYYFRANVPNTPVATEEALEEEGKKLDSLKQRVEIALPQRSEDEIREKQANLGALVINEIHANPTKEQSVQEFAAVADGDKDRVGGIKGETTKQVELGAVVVSAPTEPATGLPSTPVSPEKALQELRSTREEFKLSIKKETNLPNFSQDNSRVRNLQFLVSDLDKMVAETERELDRKKKTPSPEQIDAGAPKRVVDAPVPQPEVSVAENPFSTFSLNVSDVSFKLAGASLEKGQMPEAAAVRSEEFINAFDYRDPEPTGSAPIAFNWDRARYPFAHNRDMLRFSVKTAAIGRQAGRPLNLVLLLDNSGSMERADRVRIIQECLRVLAKQLTAQDRISVVAFSRTARLWVDGLPGNQAGALPQQVGNLAPQGGTNLEDAMNVAYQTALRHYLTNGVNRVVLLTDGAANLGDVEPESLKKKVEANRLQGIALDCFGIGWEGYNDDLLETLSRNGDGRYGFVNTPEAATSEFAGQLAGALKVAASDVKVQIEFNPRRVTNYRQIGYAKHQLKKEQFRDNTVDAAEIGAAEAGNALYVVQVNPHGEGPLATVRVRYKVPGTADYREHEWAVSYNGPAKTLDQSNPAMRLATVASAFSEWLVSSPYASEVSPDQLVGYLAGVPETCSADPRPKKLEWMIRQAKSISGK